MPRGPSGALQLHALPHVDGEIDTDAQGQGRDHDRHHVPFQPEQHHGTHHPKGGKHNWGQHHKRRDEPSRQQQEHHEGDRQRDGRGLQLRHAKARQHGLKDHEVSGHVHLCKSIQIRIEAVFALDAVNHGDEGRDHPAGIRGGARFNTDFMPQVGHTRIAEGHRGLHAVRPRQPSQRISDAGVGLKGAEGTEKIDRLARQDGVNVAGLEHHQVVIFTERCVAQHRIAKEHVGTIVRWRRLRPVRPYHVMVCLQIAMEQAQLVKHHGVHGDGGTVLLGLHEEIDHLPTRGVVRRFEVRTDFHDLEFLVEEIGQVEFGLKRERTDQ